MANAFLSLSFREPDILDDPEEKINASLVLESKDNEGKTSFKDSDTVLLRYFTSSSKPYQVNTTQGFARKHQSNLTFSFQEFLIFTNTDQAFLSYKPKGAVSHKWIGTTLGTVHLNGQDVQISRVGNGILELNYKVRYDLISHRIFGFLNKDIKTMVYVSQGNSTVSQVLDYAPSREKVFLPTPPPNETGTGESGILDGFSGAESGGSSASSSEAKPITLVVRDYSTNAPLGEVSVTLNGISKGKTDSSGTLFLGNLSKGTYNLSLSKNGYFSSNEDNLANDSFSVD